MSQLRPSFRFIAVSFLVLLPLVLAQQDPASCTVSCRFVVVPTVGPPGLNGTTGAQGPIGPIGATGQTGAQGAQGVMGPAGAKGDKGDKGDTGATGQTGSQGSQGIQGIQGPKGDKGDTGATGQTGLQGIQGPKGDTGVFDPMSTLPSPTTTGQLSMTGKLALLSFGPTYTNCVGSQTGDDLVIETSCSVGYANVGDFIEWGDGTVANIVDVATVNGAGQSWSMTLVRDGGPANRISAPFKLYSARAPNPNNAATQISPMVTALGGRLVLRGGLSGYGGSSAVSINMFKMDSRNARHHARWSFPYPGPASDTSYHLFVGEQTAQTVSNKVITASVIKASETNGHIRMKTWGSLGISDPTDNSNGYTMINVTITGSLVTTNTELFYPSHTGSVLEWSDGAAAVIQTVGPLGGAGSTTFTAARAFQTPRAWQMVKWWTANTMLSNNFAMFQDKIALKAVIGTAGSALTIDMTKMRVDAGVRYQTSWTFPNPGPAGQQNYFVGEESVQTLTNKVLASPSITGVVGGAPIFPTLVASPDTTGWTNCVGTTDGLGKVTFATGTRVNMADIGSLIRWADGTSSVLIDTPGQTSAIGTVDDSTVRTNVACAVFGPNNAFFTGKQYLSMGSPIFHSTNANRVAFLSLASMALNTKATYLLPPISGAGQTTMASDTLVATSTAQTLSNKALKAVSSIEFKPATDGTWNAVNAESVPQTWTPPRPAATGTTSLDSYETLTMQMRMTGHFGTIGGDSTTARYLTVMFTRIGKTVTMTIRRSVQESSNSRPAGTIGTDPNSPFPAVFRPVDDQSFYMRVINAGVFALGSCFVSKAGTFLFGAGPLGEAFTAIPASTPQWSGFESVAGQWVMP